MGLTRCFGENCPIKDDCYRYTLPVRTRDTFTDTPYNKETKSCEFFISNTPTDEFIRNAAYYIWQSKGKPIGKDLEIWDEAKRLSYESYGRRLD